MTSLKTSGASRRQEYSAATKRALTDVAEELFTEHGYAATSLDAVVAGARVTKGALYHHFSGKQDLFQAVFERIEDQSAPPWSRRPPTARTRGSRPPSGCTPSSASSASRATAAS